MNLKKEAKVEIPGVTKNVVDGVVELVTNFKKLLKLLQETPEKIFILKQEGPKGMDI